MSGDEKKEEAQHGEEQTKVAEKKEEVKAVEKEKEVKEKESAKEKEPVKEKEPAKEKESAKEKEPVKEKEPAKEKEKEPAKEKEPVKEKEKDKGKEKEKEPAKEKGKEKPKEAGAEGKSEDFKLNVKAKEWKPKTGASHQQQKRHQRGNNQQQKLPNSNVMPPMNPVLAQQYVAAQKQQQMLAQIAQHQRMTSAFQANQPAAVEALVRQAHAAQYAQALQRQHHQQLEIRRLTQQLQQQSMMHKHLMQQQQATLPSSPEAMRALRELQVRKMQLQSQAQATQARMQSQVAQASTPAQVAQNQQLQQLQKQLAELQAQKAASAEPVSSTSSGPTIPGPPVTGPAIIKIAGGKSVNFDELKPGASVLGSTSSADDLKLMAALKNLTGRPLNNLVFEQRAPRGNQPNKASMQFVVKPVHTGAVTRFDELAVQELNAFHQDLCSVLRALRNPKSLHMECGNWNWHSEPFMYVTCWDHQAEVMTLDPTVKANDLPADKKHPNDDVRYVTRMVCDDERLKCFRSACFVDALGSGGDLRKLYQLFHDTFSELPGYEMQVHNLCSGKAEFVVKAQAPLPNHGHLSTKQGTIVDWSTLPTSAEQRAQPEPLQGMLGLRKKQG